MLLLLDFWQRVFCLSSDLVLAPIHKSSNFKSEDSPHHYIIERGGMLFHGVHASTVSPHISWICGLWGLQRWEAEPAQLKMQKDVRNSDRPGSSSESISIMGVPASLHQAAKLFYPWRCNMFFWMIDPSETAVGLWIRVVRKWMQCSWFKFLVKLIFSLQEKCAKASGTDTLYCILWSRLIRFLHLDLGLDFFCRSFWLGNSWARPSQSKNCSFSLRSVHSNATVTSAFLKVSLTMRTEVVPFHVLVWSCSASNMKFHEQTLPL